MSIKTTKWFCEGCEPKDQRGTHACPNCCGFAWDPMPVAGRDTQGNIRLRNGAGELIARHNDSRSDIEFWHKRTVEEFWRRKYQAALDLLNREDKAA